MNRLYPAVTYGNFARPRCGRQPGVRALTAAGFRLRLGTLHRASPAGLGLVEVIFATLIVGLMLVASLETVGAVFRTQQLNADRLTGPNLAMELMTEILAKPYEDPEVDRTDIGNTEDESATTRADFDDVDDYHNWDELSVVNADGSSNTAFADWRRQVIVQWVDPSTGEPADQDLGLKRITVTAINSSGEETQLMAYRAKSGMLERAETPMTAVTWVGARLQLGEDNTTASMGTNLINHATEAD